MRSFAIVILRSLSALCSGLAILCTVLTVIAGALMLSGQGPADPAFLLSLWIFTALPLALGWGLFGRAWQTLAWRELDGRGRSVPN